MTDSSDRFDYIIVGAGSAGCVLANRLSENPEHRVLLVEAGPADRNPWLHIPIGYARTFFDERYNWCFYTQSDPGLNGRVSYWPRGRVLGGSSSINAMVFCRGHHRDYDEWEKLGAKGWGWQDVLEYFKKIENATFNSLPDRGQDGPVPVASMEQEAHFTNQYFLDGCRELGFAENPDYNGRSLEGIGYYQVNTKHGLRMSSAKAYLHPARKRENLTILTHAKGHRLVFKGRICSGIVYEQNGRKTQFAANKEVILSAGAVGSPVILQRSGVGDAQQLHALDINVIHDVPQVGQNLQDHLGISYYYKSKVKTLNDELNSISGRLRAGLKYLLHRTGPLSISVNQSGGFVRSSPAKQYPDVQLYFQALSYLNCPPRTRPMIRLDRFSAFSIGISQCRPTSHGQVHISSPDPHAKPIIEPRYLSTEHDVIEALESVKLIRKIAATQSMRKIIEHELLPGEDLQDDAGLLEDFKNRADTVFHPSCTCRIGQHVSHSVVDPKLRVHGLKNLRVIDASVFPILPTGNINASAMMVGEKGADLVLMDANRRSL